MPVADLSNLQVTNRLRDPVPLLVVMSPSTYDDRSARVQAIFAGTGFVRDREVEPGPGFIMHRTGSLSICGLRRDHEDHRCRTNPPAMKTDVQVASLFRDEEEAGSYTRFDPDPSGAVLTQLDSSPVGSTRLKR